MRRWLRRLRRAVEVLGALSGVTWVVLWWTAEPAGADNCQTFTDCFSTADAASDALLGMTFLGMLSMALNFVPVVGTGKGVLESLIGRDLLTGERLSMTDRMLGLIPGGFGRFGRFGRVFAHADDMSDLGRGTRGARRLGPGDVPVAPRAAGRGGRPPPPPRRPPAPGAEPPRRPPHGSTPDRSGPWGDDRSRVQAWRERWWDDQRPARTANGEETTIPSRNPSVDYQPEGRPEPVGPNAAAQNASDIRLQNNNAEVLSEHGFHTVQRPSVGPDGRPATADYEIEGRLFEHKVAHTNDVRNFYDNELERNAARYLRKGTQADRFVVHLPRDGITPDQLRTEILSRSDTDVQELLVVYEGDVIPLYP